MTHQATESKRLLSYVIAEWACVRKYEHLSAEAIQAAKLFWLDSIGCALGGSQQDDAKILLKHYRAMSSAKAASRDSSTFFFQAEDGIRDLTVTGVQTCALPI